MGSIFRDSWPKTSFDNSDCRARSHNLIVPSAEHVEKETPPVHPLATHETDGSCMFSQPRFLISHMHSEWDTSTQHLVALKNFKTFNRVEIEAATNTKKQKQETNIGNFMNQIISYKRKALILTLSNYLIHTMNVPYIETMITINNHWKAEALISSRFEQRGNPLIKAIV